MLFWCFWTFNPIEMKAFKGPCQLLFAQTLLGGFPTDKASHDKHPIQSCQAQSVQSSSECFCISVLFILPLSPLCSWANRASRADWQKEVLAPARGAWLTSRRWKSASKDFTVILGRAEASDMTEGWRVWELALALGGCTATYVQSVFNDVQR